MAQETKFNAIIPDFFLSFSTIYFHLEHTALFNNSAFEVSQTTNKKFYTRLATSLKYTNIPTVVTPYLSNYIHLPVIQTQHVHQFPQLPVDQYTQARVSTPLHVLHHISSSSMTESQVNVRADQGIVEPQSPTQVIEPHSESNIPQQSTSRPKLQVK